MPRAVDLRTLPEPSNPDRKSAVRRGRGRFAIEGARIRCLRRARACCSYIHKELRPGWSIRLIGCIDRYSGMVRQPLPDLDCMNL
jgi:hypothetical protein